jgi:hypothetical protein
MLRLGPLPRNESVKLTFSWSASLKADLDRYAELHAQTYGEATDAITLIPHMLEALVTRDRSFRSARNFLSVKTIAPPMPAPADSE